MHDDAACDLLMHMVEIPSLSTAEAPLAEFLVSAMRGAGFDAHIDEAGNAIGCIGSGPETVVLLGHMDTVAGLIPVRVEDGVLWGRGAVDAKGSLAAFVAAASRAASAGNLRRRVLVAGCVEEEVSSSKGAHFLANRWPAPDWCVVGEPSGADRVTLGYKGNLRLSFSLEQGSAHSAHAAATAAERGYLLWQRIRSHAETFNQGRDRAFDQLLPTLVSCVSGSDGLVDRCTLSMNVRLPLDCPPAQFEATVRAELEPDWRVETSGGVPAFASERTSPLVRRFNRALRQHGHQSRHVLKTGTADLNVVGPAWGCPIVAYGPGDARLDHTPEERIELAEYLHSVAILTTLLEGD